MRSAGRRDLFSVSFIRKVCEKLPVTREKRHRQFDYTKICTIPLRLMNDERFLQDVF